MTPIYTAKHFTYTQSHIHTHKSQKLVHQGNLNVRPDITSCSCFYAPPPSFQYDKARHDVTLATAIFFGSPALMFAFASLFSRLQPY